MLMVKWGSWIVFVLAYIPNHVFEIGEIVAGTLKLLWWIFFSVEALGKSIRFVLFTLLSPWEISFFACLNPQRVFQMTTIRILNMEGSK